MSPVAPMCRFGRSGAEVLIRYRHAGEVVTVSVPHPVWLVLVEAVHGGKLDALHPAWSRWQGAEGGAVLVALRVGHVHVEFGYVRTRELRMPLSVWRQIAAAIRARAVDSLPAVSNAEIAAGQVGS
ncbi:hypothetical protein [Frankia sp. AgPm24]|uniref:hypothetical protein n=1 Tax=Frankia sp. AgPm24 TaxID=631128 RepID=UPI002010A2DA|nr:hypothetical protein [Frankia sp. AgPm24]